LFDAKNFIMKVDIYLSGSPDLLQRFLKMIMLVKKYDTVGKGEQSIKAFTLAREIVKDNPQILKELEEVRRAGGGREEGEKREIEGRLRTRKICKIGISHSLRLIMRYISR
jgi:hypothetical protein